MSKESEENKKLQAKNEELQAKLDEALETLRAITGGEVDALVVNDQEGGRVYTLQGAEQPYRVMVENMLAGACTTMEDGTIIYSNEHFARMLKAPLEKVTGSSILSLVSDEDKARLEALFKRANAVRISEEIKLRAPDGSDVPAYLSINNISSSNAANVTIVAIDLTEHKRFEDALRDSEERFRSLVTATSEVVYRMSPDWSEMLQLRGQGFIADAEKPTGNWFEEYIPEDEQTTVMEAIDKAVRTKSIFELEHRVWRVDGTAGWVFSRAIPRMDANGEIVEWFGAASDITERKRAEEEALSMQKLESLRILAGGIAHDLNNLMVAVMGNAGLALRVLPPNAPAREYVADIEKATEKVTNFSNQILSFTSKAPAKREPVQLNQVVEDTAHFLLASISKAAELEYILLDGLPVIMADPQSMQQIVMNLTINASDAIGERKGSIKVSTGKMYADRKYLDRLYKNGIPEGEYVYVEVSDTGCGISPETRKRIFEPFFTTKFTGRGIGLSAVFGIVSAHGGTIAIESEEGCGATFRVLLPVPARPVKAAAAKPVSEDIWSGKGTILVCDDERDSLLMAKKVLEGAGYSVLTAGDGAEAIKIYRKNSDTISVVILDLIMPHVRGDVAAKEMRMIRDDVNILLLSGYHEIDLTEINNGPGKTATLEKPYKISKLLGAVHDILKA